jgi:hypothetical protein
LLGTDVGASLVLLRRKVLGQKLTSREKKILKRTATDIASVVPIGILMLLPVSCWKTWYLICLKLTVENLVDSLQHQRIRNQPAFSYMMCYFVQVTAVGHAAILAAIQKYVPALVRLTISLIT